MGLETSEDKADQAKVGALLPAIYAILSGGILEEVDSLSAQHREDIFKVLWRPTITFHLLRCDTRNIDGFVECPRVPSTVTELSIEYERFGSDKLEANWISMVFAGSGGHEALFGPDLLNHRDCAKYEAHKKLRPGYPEDEQWFHNGLKNFVAYDTSRLDGLCDAATFAQCIKQYDFERHHQADMEQWGLCYYTFAPSGVLALMGDINSAQIPWNRLVPHMRQHRESGYTFSGFSQLCMAGMPVAPMNYWPLARHQETKDVSRRCAVSCASSSATCGCASLSSAARL